MTTLRPLFEDDEERTVFEVALDDVTVARLIEVSEGLKRPPALVIAALLRDLLDDDVLYNSGDDDEVVYRRDANKDLN